jgi:glycosyltransferase involved in cell wall biosynthesis/LmbE family N-acetylglucosaminyl deacetylase/SAM-dependent methyltransferase
MNICFTSLSYSVNGEPTSGVGSQVRLLAHALVDAGHWPTVVDLAPEEACVVTDERGVNVYREPSGKLHWFISKVPVVGRILASPVREIEYSIAVWRGVRKANRERTVDLIEGTETGMLLLALLWKQSPLLIRLHGERYTFQKYTPGVRLTLGLRLSRALQRVALRRAKLLISPSYAHAREIHNELGTPHPEIVVVPNALAIENSNGRRATTQSKTVLYAGRIEQCKGIKTLLHAAAQTRAVMPESRFVFAGDFHSSVSPAEFQALVSKHNLENNIDLLGPVDWATLKDLYRASTLAVLPSHYETFGLAALEPMAFGTPVVACNSSALPEVVIHEKTGKLVTPGDCVALADAMIDLLSHPETRQKMSSDAIEHAARFDVRKLLPLNERLYSWCVEDFSTNVATHIFFSPHLDDAVFSCGGAIHSLLEHGRAVRVVTVFANETDGEESAFARHLHRKWKLDGQASRLRQDEDRKALGELGVQQMEHWEYAEAPYRRGLDGESLYGTYDELCDIAETDVSIVEALTQRVLSRNDFRQETILYFPLSLGRHADHRILFEVGRSLHEQGLNVRFYEDFPYAERYDADATEGNWLSRTVSIDLASKVKACAAYTSQLIGLGGSPAALEKRLQTFAARITSQDVMERYWEIAPQAQAIQTGGAAGIGAPFKLRKNSSRLAEFKNFLRTFRWHDLDEILPIGSGNCLDLGCGSGRHKSVIEARGYRCVALDRSNRNAQIFCDAAALPVRSESQAAVVAWQMLEYVEQPERVVAEVGRVLEPGGILCGSASFLEPVHGRTYYNLSPLILEKLLRANGFSDIDIKPGLNGFVLLPWTWLRRTRIPLAERFASPMAFLLLVPSSLLLFGISWLSRFLGFGNGHFMRWLAQTAPLEFAGHVMFSARKKARR